MHKLFSSDKESLKIKINQAKLDTKLLTWDLVADKNLHFGFDISKYNLDNNDQNI